MKKRTFALLLAICMALGLFAGCGGTTESAEPSAATSAGSEEAAAPEASEVAEPEEASATETVAGETIQYPVGNGETYTISVVADGNLLDSIPGSDPANCYGIAQMCEATGINLDYTVFAMLSDNMTLMISSGDWTDIICKIDENYTGGIAGALAEEVVLDIAPYLEEYAPDYYNAINAKPDFAKTAYTDDGQMGAFYKMQTGAVNGWAIRKDWLEEAGVTEIPETFDEFEAAALAVLDKHPELEAAVPMAGSFIAEGYEGEIMYGYNMQTMGKPDFRIEEDGSVGYIWTSDDARSYIEMIARFAAEGIFSVDQILSGDLANYSNDLYTGNALAKFNGAELFGDDQLAIADDPNFEIVPMNVLTVNKGDALRVGGAQDSASVAWSLSGTCHDVETLISAINWIYTEEGTIAMNFGLEGTTYTKDDSGYHFTDLVMNNPDGIAQFLAVSIATGLEVPGVVMEEQAIAKFTNNQQLDALEYWKTQTRGTEANLKGTLNVEETEAVSSYADIDTVVQERMMAFATGATEINDDTWNDFVTTVESMGIDDIVAVYQGAEDRWNGK